MSPEKKAVTQTLIDELSGMYAGEDMRKQLQSMKIASGVKEQDRNVDMTGRKIDLNETLRQGEFDLDKKAYKNTKDELNTAENLGYLNIGLSGLTGLGAMHQKKKKAKTLEDIAKEISRS